MPYIETSPFIFDCQVCHTRCDGVSKGVYLFENDIAFSEKFEQLIIAHINSSGKYAATKSEGFGYPDIAVYKLDGSQHIYLEVKVQQRTFMTVEKWLPLSKLQPSETVALNLSDLIRYFTIQNETKIPVSIVWVLLNRPCILKNEPQMFFYQTADNLQSIYEQQKELRRFRRKSGEGDVVNGEHKGVVVNYHFSLKELQPWQISSL